MRPGQAIRSGQGMLRRTALLVLAAVAVVVGSIAGSASATSTLSTKPSPDGSSGLVGYPPFLPKSTLHVRSDQLLVGTTDRPALTSQGDPVKVVTRRWSAQVTVRGPEVPVEGLGYRPPAITCTWTVTMSRATKAVPISLSDFDSIDEFGNVYHPTLVPGQTPPPRLLEPGHTVTFELRAVEAVGEGLMRWAPIGRHIVANWDFVVEID